GRMEEGEKELKLAAELKTEGLRKAEIKTAAYLDPASLGEHNGKLLEEASAVRVVAEPGTMDEKAAGELKSGEDYYTKMVASAHNNSGMLRGGGRDLGGAAEQFARAARWTPQLEEIHFNWGLACYKAELYQQAITPLESELKITPASLPAKQLLGTSYFMADDYPKASALLAEVVSVKTNDAGLYYMLRIALLKQKERDEA